MNMKNIDSSDFFFCYTRSVSDYLSEQGIRYVLKAKSIKDGNTFTMYQKNEELQKTLMNFNSSS